jgi:hypothetical protein
MLDIFKKEGLKPIKGRLLYDDTGKSKCAGFIDFNTPHEA